MEITKKMDKVEMNMEKFTYKNPITIIERFCSQECREYCYSEIAIFDLQEDYDIEIKWIFQELKKMNLFKLFPLVKQCNYCGKQSENVKKCSKCFGVEYCDLICQKNHWKIHRKDCKNSGHLTMLTFL